MIKSVEYLQSRKHQRDFLDWARTTNDPDIKETALINVARAQGVHLRAKRFKASFVKARFKVRKEWFKSPLRGWLPNAQRFDSWATRFGALSVIKVLAQVKVSTGSDTESTMISVPLGYVDQPFTALSFLGTMILCLAALAPLIMHVKDSLKNKARETVVFRALFGSILLGFATLGMAFTRVALALNLLMSREGALLLALFMIAAASIIYSLLNFEKKKAKRKKRYGIL